MAKVITLYAAARDKRKFTEGEARSLLYILGKYCSADIKNKLKAAFEAMPTEPTIRKALTTMDESNSLKLYETDAFYEPENSYKDEIRKIRQAFLTPRSQK
jgi:hypothetical protein